MKRKKMLGEHKKQNSQATNSTQHQHYACERSCCELKYTPAPNLFLFEIPKNELA